MSENINESSLREFLTNISEGAIFSGFNYTSPREFLIDLKTKVPLNKGSNFYNNYTKTWIERFGKFSSTAWIVRANFPNLKRLVYRKVYVCHRSAFNKKVPQHRPNERNMECKARIDFRVKLSTKNTLKNNKLLREGYNMEICIKFLHTHPIWDSTSLHLLRTDSAVDEIFIGYMIEGMTPKVAKNYHNIALAAEYGLDGSEMTRTFNPTSQHIWYLLSKLKAQKTVIMEPDEILLKKKEELESENYCLHFEDNNYIIITPFMKRVALNVFKDILIIDTTQINSDFISIYYVPTEIGALPIASAIHTSNTETNIQYIFCTIRTLLEQITNEIFQPKNVMCVSIDNLFGIPIIRPRYAVITELWEHLNEVSHTDSIDIMNLITSMINTNIDSEPIYLELKQKCDNPVIIEYVNRLWDQRFMFQCEILEQNVDITIRLIKQFLMSRCESFNSVILIDIVTRVLERHWRKIIQAHCTNNNIESAYLSLLNDDNKSKTKIDTVFLRNTWCCNCSKGKKGQFCSHLSNNLDILKVVIPHHKMQKYLALVGSEQCSLFKLKFNATMVKTSEDEDMIPVQGNMDDSDPDNSDPLNNSISSHSYEIPLPDFVDEESYKIQLRVLHAEFIRLSKMFKENKNATNMNAMYNLARELSKIRPERVNVRDLEPIVYNDEKVETSD